MKRLVLALSVLFLSQSLTAQTLEQESTIAGLRVFNCSGCDSVPFPDYVAEGAKRLLGFGLKDRQKALLYDYDLNTIHLIEMDSQGLHVLRSFRASGGNGGVNNRLKSGGTPPGVHKIYRKQGDGFALNQTFDARKYGYRETRVTPTTGYESWKSDFVMTRILRLQGLEGEKNNNSVQRSILFHGTPEEGLIGYHHSAGCIRMYNKEIEWLYDQVSVGTLVNVVYRTGRAVKIPANQLTPVDETKIPELRR